MSENGKKGIFGLINRIEGDKVIWIILLMLIMFALVCISSSTPLLAIMEKSTRGHIIAKHVAVTALGIGIVLFFYTFVKKIGVLRFFSKLGFFFSFVMLAMLAIRINTPLVRAVEINKAVRVLSVFHLQLHVFEFTKVLMVMYLAWAVQAWRENNLRLADRLVAAGVKFMEKPVARLYLYIFIPMLLVTGLTLRGGVSSTLFITLIMLLTVFIGGVTFRKIMGYLGVMVCCLVLAGTVGEITGKKVFERLETVPTRILMAKEDPEEVLESARDNKQELNDLLDKYKQPLSAKVAISEGGLLGKGPGGSTQRYIVPIMFEDFMFSFIVEEYGILGAIIIIILYGGLLARGSILVRNSTSPFTKTAIAGLVAMISGQALMHMLINVDIGPLTGQTLPLISHGSASFIAFCMAFGIILAISRMIKKRMDKEEREAAPIVPSSGDNVKDGLGDLDQLESL